MGRQAAERTAVIGRAQRGQRERVNRIRQARAIPHRDQAAGMKFHVGVAGVLQRLLGGVAARRFFQTRPQRLAGGYFFTQRAGLHPAVAVADLAAVKVDAVQHAVAVIGVVAPAGLKIRVRAIAHIQAVQVGGHVTDHRQVFSHQLVLHRGVVAAECRDVVLGQAVALHHCLRRLGRDGLGLGLVADVVAVLRKRSPGLQNPRIKFRYAVNQFVI